MSQNSQIFLIDGCIFDTFFLKNPKKCVKFLTNAKFVVINLSNVYLLGANSSSEKSAWRFLYACGGQTPQRSFLMRKLLLVMLVPVLVLGVMGCGNKIDADVQTDYLVQGSWVLDDYTLVINAATMVVKYVTDVSTPYRTEWSYISDPTDRTANPEGEMTLFDYHSNGEIATIHVLVVPGETLTVSDIVWNVEEYYYSNAFPIEGEYIALSKAGEETTDPTLVPATVAMYDIDITGMGGVYGGSIIYPTVTLKTGETAGAPTIKYDGSTTEPTDAGTYTVTFDTAETATHEATTGLAVGTLTIDKAAAITLVETTDWVCTWDGSAAPVVGDVDLVAGGAAAGGTVTIIGVFTDYGTASEVEVTSGWGSLASGDYTVVFEVEVDGNHEPTECTFETTI
jgi:hypothetical protein